MLMDIRNFDLRGTADRILKLIDDFKIKNATTRKC